MTRRGRYTYSVVENTPGYMPDSEPQYFTNRRDAEAYAASLAKDLRDNDYHVYGNARDGYYAELDKDDLGRVVEVGQYPRGDLGETDEDFS